MSSNISPAIADIIIRSRHTILQVLRERGYDTTPYENIAPSQLITLAEGGSAALDILVKREPDSTAPCANASVRYLLHQSIRLKITTFTRDLLASLEESGDDSSNLELIYLLNEPYNDVFDKASLQMWQDAKVRVAFIHIKHLVVHPGKHVLVPPHRKLTVEEAAAEIKNLYITQKSQFPFIKHSDIQAKLLGMVPGDLVEVLRPSPTSGVARVVRVCVA